MQLAFEVFETNPISFWAIIGLGIHHTDTQGRGHPVHRRKRRWGGALRKSPNRYERRAAARRDRAIRALTQSDHQQQSAIYKFERSDLAKRTQFLFEIRGTYCFDLRVSVQPAGDVEFVDEGETPFEP
jgi:hypothetical protein